jgi:hypothetical protein
MSEFCTMCGISPVLGNGHKSLDTTFFCKGLILNVPNVWLSWFRILTSPQWTQYFKASMPKIRAGVLKWERQLLSLVVGGIPMSGGLHASTRSILLSMEKIQEKDGRSFCEPFEWVSGGTSSGFWTLVFQYMKKTLWFMKAWKVVSMDLQTM